MIETRHLAIGYSGKVVAEDLNMSAPSGVLTCLLGRNGVGKSTLLRTLSGSQRPIAGEVLIDGEPLIRLSRHDLARRMAIVLTGRPPYAHLTAEELVALGRSPYTGFFGTLRPADRERVAAALQQVGMEAFAGRQVQTLSDGEMQKLMMAKALAQDTAAIVLDEPTAFLDYPGKVDTMRLLSDMAAKQGKTILISTHDVELALRFGGRLLLFEKVGGVRAVSSDEVREALLMA